MSQFTTKPRSGQSSVFAPGGLQWVAMPLMPPGPAQVVLSAILRLARKATAIWATDHELAELAGCSLRLIQKGLAVLEAMGWIERQRRRGSRKITIKIRLAGKCTDSHDCAASTGTGTLHLFAQPCESLKSGGKREESAASPALPVSSRADEPLEKPYPAAERFFSRLIPAEARS